MDDIASFAVWLMIALLLINFAISAVGSLDYFKQTGLSPGMKVYQPQGIVSGVAAFLDNLVAGMTGQNYVSGTTPTISQDIMPRTNQVQGGLFSNFAAMFYTWENLVGFFAAALPGGIGVLLYIFTSFIEIIQLVGLFILLARVATIAKLIIPI